MTRNELVAAATSQEVRGGESDVQRMGHDGTCRALTCPGPPSILTDVGCTPRGSTLIEEGLGEWTSVPRRFL
jgi:hypothetical protein